jgi:hypothetical protein
MRLGYTGMARALSALRSAARLVDDSLGPFALSPITLSQAATTTPPHTVHAAQSSRSSSAPGRLSPDAIAADAAEKAVQSWRKPSPLTKAATRIAAEALDSVAGSFPAFAAWSLGLWDVYPVQPSVVFVSRKNKRFVLNEPEFMLGLEEKLRLDSVAGAVASLQARQCEIGIRNSSDPTATIITSQPLPGSEKTVDLPPPPSLELATLEDMPLFEQASMKEWRREWRFSVPFAKSPLSRPCRVK